MAQDHWVGPGDTAGGLASRTDLQKAESAGVKAKGKR